MTTQHSVYIMRGSEHIRRQNKSGKINLELKEEKGESTPFSIQYSGWKSH